MKGLGSLLTLGVTVPVQHCLSLDFFFFFFFFFNEKEALIVFKQIAISN